MKFRVAVVCLLLAPGMLAAADKQSKERLDVKVDALFDRAKSTGDQIRAAETGRKLWDAEMNRRYQMLRTRLDPKASAALQAAQRKWVEWRDAEFAAIDAYYDQFEGTMYLPMRVSAEMEIIRQRARTFREQLDMLDER